MKRKKLLWHIFPAFLTLTVFSLIAVSFYASRSVEKLIYLQVQSDLFARAVIAEKLFEPAMEQPYSYANEICQEISTGTDMRITVILPDGKVVADSFENPEKMDNHRTRPEVATALSGGKGISVRYSNTLGKQLMYVCIPIKKKDTLVGVIRTSIPLLSISESLRGIYAELVYGGIIIALITSIVSFLISIKISRPLVEMKEIALNFASGKLTTRMNIPDSDEIGSLAEAMNEMAEQLHNRITALTRQKNEQQAILASMIEGVIALNNDKQIISINYSASEFFSLSPERATGKSIDEITENQEFLSLVNKTMLATNSIEGEFILHEKGEKHFQLHGTILKDEQNNKLGAVIVLNDITKIYKLENMRQDFVANVSHELKTPITAIKGFIETLADGAIDEPEKSSHFLEIISRQADRLNAIISDLLSLSRIEVDARRNDIHTEEAIIEDIINVAVLSSQFYRKKKNISVTFPCDSQTRLSVDVQLLEQALINLVENAAKYSDEKSQIKIDIENTEKMVTISVTDEGCGIADKHHSRLFERFYRVDKARSRKLGGTGLGLAIVKHIAQAHGGSVSVESKVGIGSRFSIHLPRQ